MTLQLGYMTYHYYMTHSQTKFFGRLAKNRVWTLSLEKLEPVNVWRSVIVGVEYIISYQ